MQLLKAGSPKGNSPFNSAMKSVFSDEQMVYPAERPKAKGVRDSSPTANFSGA